MVRSTSYRFKLTARRTNFDLLRVSVLDQTQITEPGVANYTDDDAQQQEEYKVK